MIISNLVCPYTFTLNVVCMILPCLTMHTKSVYKLEVCIEMIVYLCILYLGTLTGLLGLGNSSGFLAPVITAELITQVSILIFCSQ